MMPKNRYFIQCRKKCGCDVNDRSSNDDEKQGSATPQRDFICVGSKCDCLAYFLFDYKKSTLCFVNPRNVEMIKGCPRRESFNLIDQEGIWLLFSAFA